VVVTASNPIFSILGLILIFGNVTIILLLLNVEFLALSLLLVYVGAIAVLFLLLIMMLNIKLAELSTPNINYLPVTFLFSSLLSGLLFSFSIIQEIPDLSSQTVSQTRVWLTFLDNFSDISIIGQVLFLFYAPTVFIYGGLLTLPLLCLGLFTKKKFFFIKTPIFRWASSANYKS
jgi:NADH-ubiquinone oxidoreductase chain 6